VIIIVFNLLDIDAYSLMYHVQIFVQLLLTL